MFQLSVDDTAYKNFILPCFLQRNPPDWQDFVRIITLLFINSTISFIEENNARNATAALMGCLAPKAKVLRDGKWSGEDVVVLIPGDVVSIKLGDIIPADVRLLEGDPLKIDQSALTDDSLPVTKSPRDGVYSGSTCKQEEIEAVVNLCTSSFRIDFITERLISLSLTLSPFSADLIHTHRRCYLLIITSDRQLQWWKRMAVVVLVEEKNKRRDLKDFELIKARSEAAEQKNA
ncbi:hypothetical protein ACSBR2_019595 [Camellia fascicularis]